MVFCCCFPVLGGSCWFLWLFVVLSDFRQFLVVFGGHLEVLGGSYWFLFFFASSRALLVIIGGFGGSWRFLMIF